MKPHQAVPIHTKGLDLLASRGIRPGFRGNPRSQNLGIGAVLLRLDRLAAATDLEPRLGSTHYRLALELLADPWALSASDIEALPTLFRRALRASTIALPSDFDPEPFLALITELDYADRLALVCSAEQHHAAASA